jgi:MSHA biogenesis protein MshK
MLSPSRKVAVISGEVVALGGRYGGARLVRLTESEAVLKNGADVTVLRLHPLVEKRVAASGTGKSALKATK